MHQGEPTEAVDHSVVAMEGPWDIPEVASAERTGTERTVQILHCPCLCLLLVISFEGFDTCEGTSDCEGTGRPGSTDVHLDNSIVADSSADRSAAA